MTDAGQGRAGGGGGGVAGGGRGWAGLGWAGQGRTGQGRGTWLGEGVNVNLLGPKGAPQLLLAAVLHVHLNHWSLRLTSSNLL